MIQFPQVLLTQTTEPAIRGIMPDRPMSMINQALIQRIESRFKARFGSLPDHIARAPGRVNLLGEHVDYNQGLVIPAAIDRAAYVAFSAAPGSETTILADDFNEEVTVTDTSVKKKVQANGFTLPEWSLYPAGVMSRLAEYGIYPVPIQAVFASDVPRGAGLSSSASIQAAFITTWLSMANAGMPPMRQALLCQQAENEYVGVKSGIMDQFVSICGMKDHLLLLDCRSLEWESTPLPASAAIVIADTGKRRKLTAGGYNQRRAECEEAVRLLSRDMPDIQNLRDVSVKDFNRLAHRLPPLIEKRARHVVEELARVAQAWDCLKAADLSTFGRLMNACHTSLRDLYEVSSPELDTMAQIAQSLEGCLGARLTGAGFGGCCVCLTSRDQARSVAENLAIRYQALTRIKPEIFITSPVEGAGLIRDGSSPSNL